MVEHTHLDNELFSEIMTKIKTHLKNIIKHTKCTRKLIK